VFEVDVKIIRDSIIRRSRSVPTPRRDWKRFVVLDFERLDEIRDKELAINRVKNFHKKRAKKD
jgi:hypothetical protein